MATSPTQSVHPTHRKRWLKATGAATLVIIALYALLALIAVPRLAMTQLKQVAANRLNSHFSAQRISFNPFSLTLTMEKPAIADRADGTAWLQANTISANLDALSSIWNRSLVLDYLHFDKPELHLALDAQGNWRYPRLNTPASATTQTPLLDFRIDQLAIAAGQLHWQDNGSRPMSLTLRRVEYQHQGFNTGSQPSHFHAELETEQGDTITLNGQYVHQQPALSATWQAENIDLPRWLRQWHIDIPGIALDQATVAGQGSLAWHGQDKHFALTAEQLTIAPARFELTTKKNQNSSDHDAPATLMAAAIEIQQLQFELPNKRLRIRHVALNRPELQAPLPPLANADTHREQYATPPASASGATNSQSWLIDEMILTDGRITIINPATEKSTSVSMPSLHVNTLGHGKQPATIQGDFVLPATPGQTSGNAHITGQIDWQQASATLSHRIQRLALKPWLPVVGYYLKVTDIAGEVNTQGNWQWQNNALTGLLDVTIADFTLADKRQPLLGWKTLQLQTTHINNAQRLVKLGPLVIQGLTGHVQLNETGNSLKALLRITPAETGQDNRPDNKKTTTKPWRIEWQAASLDDGGLDLTDARIRPPFRLQARHLSANLKPPDETGSQPTFHIESTLNAFTQATASGKLNWGREPLVPQAEGRLDNLDLASLSGYARQWLGYAIKSGKADAILRYQADDKRLHGQIDLTIAKLKLDKLHDTANSINLPLKTALALLTDKQGVTRLHIPFEGDLNNPDFSIGHLIARAFVNVVTSVAASPFKILAKLAGLGEENLQQVLFEPGQYQLRATESAKLQKLAAALRQRPAIGLRIAGLANRTKDSPALRYQHLLAELSLPAATDPDDLPMLFAKTPLQERIRRLYQARLGFARWAQLQEQSSSDPVKLVMQAWQQLLMNTTIDDSQLLLLAKKRAGQVHQYLTAAEKLASERLVLATPAINDKKPPQARLEIEALATK